MRALFALVPMIVASQALELTPSNWNEHTAGKTVFLKMFAPWCGHCKAMKPAWDAVSKEYKNSDFVLMADVDCVGEGKEICDKNGVRGFPTIKYGDPNNLEDYKGGRDEDALRKFAAELKPSCNVATHDHCSDEQIKVIEGFQKLEKEELQQLIDKAEAGIMGFEAQFEKKVKELQALYEEYVSTKEKGVMDIEKSSNMNLMKSVLHHKNSEKKQEL